MYAFTAEFGWQFHCQRRRRRAPSAVATLPLERASIPPSQLPIYKYSLGTNDWFQYWENDGDSYTLNQDLKYGVLCRPECCFELHDFANEKVKNARLTDQLNEIGDLLVHILIFSSHLSRLSTIYQQGIMIL